MKHPAISRCERQPNCCPSKRSSERGVTIVLVAAAMVAIMAMAALSIDVVTLYLANDEAQRAADSGALAAARILSIYGVTGDPQNSATYWSTACTAATQAAQTVANQNFVAGAVPSTVTVTFPQTGSCSAGGSVFGVNPVVQVQVQRGNLPTFFARIWGRRSATITASGVAEGFNSSGSPAYPSGMVSVQPRCVKPWLVANGTPPYVDPATGTITNPGIQLNYSGGAATIIGSQITLTPPGPALCNAINCLGVENNSLTQGQYVAASVQGAPVAVASGETTGDPWQQAIAGCDQTTVYACGTVGGATADLNVNLGANNGDTYSATEALINASGGGADSIVTTTYPFQIRAGFGNPLVSSGIVNDDDVITSSNSIVTVPLIDSRFAFPNKVPQPSVTVVGFLQLFVQQVIQTNGNVQGTVLNVAGCGNAGPPTSVTGSSPVPVRLINYP